MVFELKVVDPDSQDDLGEIADMSLQQIITHRYVDGSPMKGAIAL